jgi:hypothetical protein
MMRRCGRWTVAVTMFAVATALASGNSHAQDLRRDVNSDGVWIGAGTGAAAGALVSLVTEDVCSPGVCAYLGGVAGGLIGLLIDKSIGHPRPVATGSFIDDGLGNGALIGALGGTGIALLDVSLRCGPRPERVPCTREGILLDIFVTARWMALVGLLIDAAIPSRVEAPGSDLRERSQRPLRVSFNLRF